MCECRRDAAAAAVPPGQPSRRTSIPDSIHGPGGCASSDCGRIERGGGLGHAGARISQEVLGFARMLAMLCARSAPDRRCQGMSQMADFDLAIIGGGLNGVSLARDAAGRGLRVLVLEQGDLGAGASATASPMIQGDLQALERGRLGAVRETISEQDIWLRAAPHLVRPVPVVVPMNNDVRPSWLWRLGLAVHDRLSAPGPWLRSGTIDLTHHPLGHPLKRPLASRSTMPPASSTPRA